VKVFFTGSSNEVNMPKIAVNGTEIYYELHGPENAPVLVLNNGILMSTASWPLQVPAFSQHYRTLVYDCRGQGQSEHPNQPYSMEQHADDLMALLKALGIERAHILGISYGGEVAQAFAIYHPQAVRSLILVATASEVGPELRLVVRSWRDAAASNDPNIVFDVIVPWTYSPEFVRNNEAFILRARGRFGLLDLPSIVRLCDAFDALDFTPHLPEIKVPTAVVFASEDAIKGRRYADILRRGIPHAEFHCLAGAGHAAHYERPEEFNTLVLGFLAKQSV
jgi:3-oxoadipate enol-lactonase